MSTLSPSPFLCWLLPLLLTPSLALARLGESLQQCDSRYGPPKSNATDSRTGLNVRTYLFSGHRVEVLLAPSRGTSIAVGISYSRPATIGNLPLTTNSIALFLSVNAPDKTTWSPLPHNPQAWSRSDAQAAARYDPATHILAITSPRLTQILDALEARKPRGF